MGGFFRCSRHTAPGPTARFTGVRLCAALGRASEKSVCARQDYFVKPHLVLHSHRTCSSCVARSRSCPRRIYVCIVPRIRVRAPLPVRSRVNQRCFSSSRARARTLFPRTTMHTIARHARWRIPTQMMRGDERIVLRNGWRSSRRGCKSSSIHSPQHVIC